MKQLHAARLSAVAILVLPSGAVLAQPPQAQPNAPAVQGPGQYRNLFVEVGHSKDEVEARIRAAFEQLFHGDPNTQAVYFSAGANANGPLAFLSDINNNDVRSEGMSYGMMIAVQLNKKAEFDALWNWARTVMYHDAPDHPGCGYFSWSMRTNGRPNDEMPAPDGEEYFAMSLYFAAGRWGNGTGIYDYRAAADRLLTDMVHRGLVTGPTVRGVRTAMNWSVDWAWWAKDVRERQLSDRLQAFFESKGLADYGNRFTLEGDQLGSDHSAGLVAMNAVASLAATHARAGLFVEALWNTPVPSGRYRYYDGMLYLLGLLHCSGEFRIWPPAPAVAPVSPPPPRSRTTVGENDIWTRRSPGPCLPIRIRCV